MKLGLRTRLLGTVIGAILVFFIIMMVAVRTTLSNDLQHLATSQVAAGRDAFKAVMGNRGLQTTFVLQQAAGQRPLLSALKSGDASALKDIATSIAQPNAFDFVTIVDARGNVVSRANGPAGGKGGPMLIDALKGNTGNGWVRFDQAQMREEHAGNGATGSALALQSAVPIYDGPKVIGAIEGGTLFSGQNKFISDTASYTGGQVAILTGSDITSSSMQSDGGVSFIAKGVKNAAAPLQGNKFIGSDVENNVEYFAQIDPITGTDSKVIGASWFGIPLAQLSIIQQHATNTILLYGVLGLVLAIGVAVFVVNRVSHDIIESSDQVRESAKALDVLVVGSEVSNDHVIQTKRKLETVEQLIERVVPVSANGEGARLRSLAKETTGDLIVIDTLAGELNDRMRGAVDRVAELNSVVERLNKLVNGSNN